MNHDHVVLFIDYRDIQILGLAIAHRDLTEEELMQIAIELECTWEIPVCNAIRKIIG